MAKQSINVGATANDKKGDSLRAAFQKVNANFTELYTALGLAADADLNLGNFVFEDNTVRLTNSNNDDSTATQIEVAQPVRIESNLTVGGDIIPNTANGGNLGSIDKPWRSLYVSTNTVFLGGVPLSLDAGTNELTINNIPISQTINFTDITGQSSLYKPEAIIDYRSGAYYNSTAVPAGSVIIDQATYRWATDSGANSYRDTVFQPSVYSATIDGSGNITDIQITTARSYPNPDIYPDFINFELINTDNLVAIDSGIDITDPVAIAASSIFEILEAGVISIAKPIPTDISELEDIGGLLGGGTGDITFTDSTVTSGNEDEIVIQAKDDSGFATVKLNLEPVYSNAQLTAYSGESVDTFTLANGDFATGVWQDNGFGNGVVAFTGAQNIGDFFQNTLLNLTSDNVSITINSEPAFIWNGGTNGSGTDTPGFGTSPITPLSPITITSIVFRYRAQSFISVNYDNQEIRLDAQNAGIIVNANNNIQVFGDANIELQAGENLTLSAGLDINISNGSNDTIGISTGDLNITAFDDVNFRGSDSFRIRNTSTTAPIRIITDDNNTQKTWAFNVNGSLTFPDSTVQTTAYTGPQTTLVGATVAAVGGTASADETGITYSNKIAIFTEGAFTVGVWTDVQVGWTVTDNNGFTDTIASRGGFGAASFVTTVNNWPAPASGKTYVFTSPDYQPASVNPVEITVGSNDWLFNNNGSVTFPNNTVQTTAWAGIPGPYADDSAAATAGVPVGYPYHKTGTSGQVFVRLA